jgi:class 3 adenylate cyclase
MVPPATRYARNGDVSLAYQVVGEGDRDIVVTVGWIGSMDIVWEDPAYARWLERIGALGRVIMWDKRGTGLSDRVAPGDLPTMEERLDDLGAVMDAAGSERAVLLGLSEGAPINALFAATYPERTEALILYGGWARTLRGDDHPWAAPREVAEEFARSVADTWGDSAWLLAFWAPSMQDDPRMHEVWNRALQRGASPASAVAWLRMTWQMDIRHVLSSISAPTLVLHPAGDRIVRVENGRYLGERIPGARYLELPGEDHLWWIGDRTLMLDEIEAFVTGAPAHREPDRVLATVLFTDIVDSTRRASELGDRRWRDLVATHDRVVRDQLERFRGQEVKTLGDGFLATFDGPGRAIRCALAIREAVGRLGLEVRAGLHTGECELVGDDIGGIAVNIGARVGAQAGAGEVLVSSTVKDLVAGSGIEFENRGEHELKGVPGEWRLFAVDSRVGSAA